MGKRKLQTPNSQFKMTKLSGSDSVSSVQSVAGKKAAVIAAMKNIRFAATNGMSNSQIPALHDLMISHGCNQLLDLNDDCHDTQDFQHAIAHVTQCRLVVRVRESEIYSLILDECMSESVNKMMTVYIRFLEKRCGKVELRTQFLDLVQLSEAGEGRIVEDLLALLESKGIDIDGLVSVTVDGASVLTGCKTGVVTRLKEVKRGLLVTRCITHRLTRGCGEAADNVMYLLKFQGVLNFIYEYFDEFVGDVSVLRKIRSVLDGTRDSRLDDDFETGWLGVQGSLQAVIDDYSMLVSVLLENGTGRALYLHKPITSFKFLYVAHFLSDIVSHLSILNKASQKNNNLIASTARVIERLAHDRSGPNLRWFLDKVPITPVMGDTGECTFQFEGHAIRDGVNQRAKVETSCMHFVSKLVGNLRDMLTEESDETVLVALTRVFDPALYGENRSVLIGSADVVAKHLFSCGLGSETVVRQELEGFFELARVQIEGNAKMYVSVGDVMQLAFRSRGRYPLVSIAAGLLLVVPASAVDCDSAFGKQSQVETALGTSLTVDNTEVMLRLLLDNTPDSVFDFESAFDFWLTELAN